MYQQQYQQGGGQGGWQPRAPRPMLDVSNLNLTCAQCQTPITQLPFTPAMNPDGTPARPVYCTNCNRERMRNRPPRY
jgi:hypothetical protein